jgi:hypothetical protein
MYRNLEMVLSFDWIMAIENDRNTLMILIYIFGYMQSTKKKMGFELIF